MVSMGSMEKSEEKRKVFVEFVGDLGSVDVDIRVVWPS